MCLTGTDLEEKAKNKSQNSTHEYDKEISLSEQEQQSMKEMKQRPISELMAKMGFEKRLADILLYAIGMIYRNQDGLENGQVMSLEFYQRIAKYLRSIGYYGDSPFMMANYGSSEYAQAFSRVGSLFGNIYIVNEDLELQDFVVDESGRITGVEINYNNTPFKIADGAGVIIGHHYEKEVARILKREVRDTNETL